MSFRISGLEPAQFAPYFTMSPDELAARHAVLRTVDEFPGVPCRVSLEDAPVGEQVLLLSYQHHDAASPYRAAGPIYVRRNATRRYVGDGVVPETLARRLLSVRAYDRRGLMVRGEVVEGKDLAATIGELFADPSVDCLHVHNAKPGCFAARVDRLAGAPGDRLAGAPGDRA